MKRKIFRNLFILLVIFFSVLVCFNKTKASNICDINGVRVRVQAINNTYPANSYNNPALFDNWEKGSKYNLEAYIEDKTGNRSSIDSWAALTNTDVSSPTVAADTANFGPVNWSFTVLDKNDSLKTTSNIGEYYQINWIFDGSGPNTYNEMVQIVPNKKLEKYKLNIYGMMNIKDSCQ